MGKIFCIMGKSSSGKDTIFKQLKDDETLGLNEIIGYTTRPIRANETNGVEYNFVDIENFHELEAKGKVIESRCYNTVNGDWYYFSVDDESIDLQNKNYIVIITLEAYNSYKAYYGDEKVKPIYISLDDGIRLTRAINREINQKKPNYEEVCRRFLADNRDFSMENLMKANINTSFSNDNLEKTVANIKDYIRDNS